MSLRPFDESPSHFEISLSLRVGLASANSRYLGAPSFFELFVEFGHRLSRVAVLGHRDAPEIEHSAIRAQRMARFVPEVLERVVDVFDRADDRHEVVFLEHLVVVGDPDRPLFSAAQAGNLNGTAQFGLNLLDRGAVVAFDAHVVMRDGIGRVGVSGGFAQCQLRGDDHAQNPEQIGDGVPDCRERLLPGRLARGGERRGVRDAAGERSRYDSRVHGEDVPADEEGAGGRDDEDSRHSSDRLRRVFKGLEEAPARTVADGKGEDGQAQNADLLGDDHPALVRVGRNAKVNPVGRDGDGQEEHRRGAQADPLYLPFSQVHANTHQKEGEKDVMVCQVLQNGFHERPPNGRSP